ncbi:putative non-specific lipid-transfer protein 14 [Senna tora]|uniref:Putative non-specific lipid-transfer protein 14 n=1 Tax=Senna tora TaxID=362788 RepID=A0A834TF09_9FABA|nr:putative non-specific lipid-transfer protein 14 [Senna tora]
MDMGRTKALTIIGMLMLLCWVTFVSAETECSVVTQAFSACSAFITFGSPEPVPGTPCCDAVSGLNIISNDSSSIDEKRAACRCLLGLIASYDPNFSVAILPGLCGVSLGFIVQPDTNSSFRNHTVAELLSSNKKRIHAMV